MVLLSDIEGLYTADPHKDPSASLIPRVDKITPELEALASGKGSSLGTGGMKTKLNAARIVTKAGADLVITNGAHPENLYGIIENTAGAAGTRFTARASKEE